MSRKLVLHKLVVSREVFKAIKEGFPAIITHTRYAPNSLIKISYSQDAEADNLVSGISKTYAGRPIPGLNCYKLHPYNVEQGDVVESVSYTDMDKHTNLEAAVGLLAMCGQAVVEEVLGSPDVVKEVPDYFIKAVQKEKFLDMRTSRQASVAVLNVHLATSLGTASTRVLMGPAKEIWDAEGEARTLYRRVFNIPPSDEHS